MVNRVLLHGEELEGRIVADGPNCTCRNDDRCPMCGAAQADAGCAVHDGHELAALLKEAQERELTDEEISEALEDWDLNSLLDGRETPDVLSYLRETDKSAILDWLRDEVSGGKTHLRTHEVLNELRASDILEYLVDREAELLKDWIEENVEAEMTTDDNGKKVPTLNITGL